MTNHPCQDKCPEFKNEQCHVCLIQIHENPITQEIIFDAEKWIYERKSAYPMVDCVSGSSDGEWKNFRYHPVCKGAVLHDKDVITLDSDGTYSAKSKGEPTLNTDEAKYYKTYLEATRYAP